VSIRHSFESISLAVRVGVGSGALLSGVLLFACSGGSPRASDADLAQAKSRASQGASLFEQACASCHGPRGEGLAGAPPIIGATALPRYPRDQSGVQLYQDPQQIQRQAQLRVPGTPSRAEFVSALDLHTYLKLHMTTVKKPAGAIDLSDSDLLAVVNFVLIAHGSDVPAGEISLENASTVLIRPQ
jgi:hypothetical protein